VIRILKAFAWLRWRMLIKALDRTGSRDVLERFSLAMEKLGPILAAVLLIPSALFLFALGVSAGYLTATGGQRLPLQLARFMLGAVPLLSLIGPLFLPAADRTNPIRLLLLPIPPGTLYVAQSSSTFGDPWTILMVPLVLGIPVGLAAAGALVPALAALAAAVLFIILIVGLAALATSALHLIVRDRRRGELLTLLFIIVIPVVAMLPSMMVNDRPRGQRNAPRQSLAPAWAVEAGQRALAVYPSELLVTTTRASVGGDTNRVAASLAGLLVATALLHGAGFVAFRKILESPGTTGARRSAPMREAWARTIPGLSSGASAVATAQLRLAMRTPRGRSILLSPVALLGIFGLLIWRSGSMDFGPFKFDGGLGLATFASFVSVISILPIAMNQFAVDKAGLTMTLLSPLKDDELLLGKAVGNAMIAAPPVIFSLLLVLAVFPSGPPAQWITLILSLIGIYLVAAPIAAICSAVFPRDVDMNSIGRGSNAHGAAGLLGMLAFVGAGVPPLLLALLATKILAQPALAPLFALGWCVVAYVIWRILFKVALRVFASRRENLALIA
jgi:hypothetical protein